MASGDKTQWIGRWNKNSLTLLRWCRTMPQMTYFGQSLSDERLWGSAESSIWLSGGQLCFLGTHWYGPEGRLHALERFDLQKSSLTGIADNYIYTLQCPNWDRYTARLSLNKNATITLRWWSSWLSSSLTQVWIPFVASNLCHAPWRECFSTIHSWCWCRWLVTVWNVIHTCL